jgi:hypothetical protein
MNPSETQFPRPEGMKMTVSKESMDKQDERHYQSKGEGLVPASVEDLSGVLRGTRRRPNPEAHVKVLEKTSELTMPKEGFNNISTYITNRAASGESAKVSGKRIAKENANAPKKVIDIDSSK